VLAFGIRQHQRKKGVHLGEYLVAMVMVTVMSSCSIADRFADHSVEYNLQAETIKNQNLLNNIIRSAYRKPLQFTDITAITGQVSVSGTAAFTIPFGGPRSNFIFFPDVTLADSPIFTTSVLNTQEFYNGILSPIKTQMISYYLSEAFPSRVLLPLLVSEIEDGGIIYSNEPSSYSYFYAELERLILQGLTVKPISETKVLGPPLSPQDVQKMDIAKLDAQHITIAQHNKSEKADEEPRSERATIRRGGFFYQLEKSDVSYQFCFNPTSSNPRSTCPGEKQGTEIRQAGKKEELSTPQISNNRAQAGIHELLLEGRKITLKVRSVEGVIYYLGQWARARITPIAAMPMPPAAVTDQSVPTVVDQKGLCGGRDILFRIEPGRSPYPSISTTYEGNDYHIRVDPMGCDRSSQVMELVLELLALNNSAKDLPAPSAIPVLTR
jgi:hypothetical protein